MVQRATNVIVGELREVVVPPTYCLEWTRHEKGDDLVGVGKCREGLGCGHRDGEQQTSRALVAYGAQRYAGGGTCGDSVVDEHDHGAGHVQRRTAAPVGRDSPGELLTLSGYHVAEVVTVQSPAPQHRRVPDRRAALRQRTQGKFRLLRVGKLASNKDVEPTIQGGRHFGRDGNAATGET
jgi:hypothetical protein